MPELPEVETIRSQLEPDLVGAEIVEAGSHPSAKFTPAVGAIDSTITGIGRRGKFLLIHLGAGPGPQDLVVHLGMTGRLSVDVDPELDAPYLRAWWRFSDGRTLRFDDVRRFGRIRLVDAGDFSSIPTLAVAGPEPFDPELTPAVFRERIGASRRAIKTQLLSQRPVAGVGNIYADEALWLAGINPKVRRLGPERSEALLGAVRHVLRLGIDNGGTTLRDYRDAMGGEGSNQSQLMAYGRSGRPCFRCGSAMVSDVIDARTSTWCPSCQRY